MNKTLIFIKSITFLKYGLLISLALLVLFNLALIIFRLFSKYHHGTEYHKTFLAKLFLKKKFYLTIGMILTIAVISFSSLIFIPNPKVIYPDSPSLESVTIAKDKPFKIVFDRPINQRALSKSISPDIKGDWKFESTNYFFIKDTLTFIPKESPAAESRYTISMNNIKNLVGAKNTNYLLSFVAPPLPNIKSISPANEAQDILPNQEITVMTDFPHENLARLSFKITPEVELKETKKNETTYTLRPQNGFKKGTTYTLDILRTAVKQNFDTGKLIDVSESTSISQTTFKIIDAPGIANYSPKGSGILTSESIWVEFRQEMDRATTEKAFAITPAIQGSISWEGNKKLIFKPAASLTKNTSYTFSISKEALAIDGSPFEDIFSTSFTTIGHVSVIGFNPGNNASNVSLNNTVSITFNQAVDHGSAESRFSISPNIGGSFSWSGNTLIYNHSNFSYYTKYTVTIDVSVKSINGLDSTQRYTSSFTTKQQSILLNVPAFRQVHMYSCMAAAARSALSYRGVNVSEDVLLSQMGFDNTPFSGSWGDPNSIWGNPYSGIVGNVDGKSGGITWGYGAYWGPTAKAISRYRSTETKTGMSASVLAKEIANGNPVLVWWVNGIWPAYEVYWKTPSGTSIRGVNSMHVQVVKGFTGTVDNPTSFTVTDSGYNYPSRTYDIGTFMAKWGWFGNTGVVVH